MSGFGDKPFGLREIKITDIDGSNVTKLPIARVLTFKERITTGELRGDDVLQSIVSFTEALEWSLESGGISLTAYAKLTGRTTSSSGTAPSQTVSLSIKAGDQMPYMRIYGRSLGDGKDDIHAKIVKAKVTAIEGNFGEGAFFVTKCSGIAVGDAEGLIMEFVQNETAAELTIP